MLVSETKCDHSELYCSVIAGSHLLNSYDHGTSVQYSITGHVVSVYCQYWTCLCLGLPKPCCVCWSWQGRTDRHLCLWLSFDQHGIGHQVIYKVHVDTTLMSHEYHIDGLVQDCSISSALAMEILQSCTKPLILLKIPSNLTVLFNSLPS